MQVLTLDNLDFAAPEGKRLAVLGDPIVHSLSPAMHNAALAAMADTDPQWAEWQYAAVQVPQDQLPEALVRLHRAGLAGINLTLPHKVEALDLVESVEETAGRMGAINTLLRTESGFAGTNTDGYGILKGMEESLQRDPAGSDIWLFGAGGAARGIVVALLDAGARRLTVVNRSVDRLEALKEALLSRQPETAERMRFFGTGQVPMDAALDAIFINATSLGLKAEDPSPVPEAFLVPGTCVFDSTYGCTNRLSGLCAGRDVRYADGLSMLVWQGARSLELWTGGRVPVDVMRAAAISNLQKRKTDG